jgi:hypothetical protein
MDGCKPSMECSFLHPKGEDRTVCGEEIGRSISNC